MTVKNAVSGGVLTRAPREQSSNMAAAETWVAEASKPTPAPTIDEGWSGTSTAPHSRMYCVHDTFQPSRPVLADTTSAGGMEWHRQPALGSLLKCKVFRNIVHP